MATLQPEAKIRIPSLDLLRGLVMVIMALDHVRDFLHAGLTAGDPTNMSTTTPAFFFTRWITHFCAPVFVFLAGTSAFLSGTRKTKAELSAFLLKRGFWLLLIELVVMTFGLTFDPLYHLFILQVIWATGISMILLGLMVRLPFKIILITGLLIVCGHNLLDYLKAPGNGDTGFWMDLIHNARFSFHPLYGNHNILILYAFLPWFGVICCGYCFGSWYKNSVEPTSRRKKLLILGFGLILLFIGLRSLNSYGDPAPWSTQRNLVYSLLSFLNTTKYPPSLMYLCMTLGPAIVLLAFMEKAQNKIAGFFIVFGRVPFFYYVVHFYTIHLLTAILFFTAGYGLKDIVPKNGIFYFRPEDFGYSLPIVYLIWMLLIIGMYPLCRWYNRYKTTHRQWWLSYL